MWIDILATHSTAILVGIGMSTLVFAFFALANRVDAASKKSLGARLVLLRLARYGLGPICGVVVGASLLHIFFLAKTPNTALLALLVAAVTATCAYWKYQPFGKVELPRSGEENAV